MAITTGPAPSSEPSFARRVARAKMIATFRCASRRAGLDAGRLLSSMAEASGSFRRRLAGRQDPRPALPPAIEVDRVSEVSKLRPDLMRRPEPARGSR